MFKKSNESLEAAKKMNDKGTAKLREAMTLSPSDPRYEPLMQEAQSLIMGARRLHPFPSKK